MKDRPFHTISELAKELGEAPKRLWYFARTAKTVPEPEVQRGRRSVYSDESAQRIKEAYRRSGQRLEFVNDYLPQQEIQK